MCSDVQRWPQTDRVWRQFDLLDLVMEHMQADPVAAVRAEEGKAIGRARDVCLVCPWQRRCRALLERGETDAIMAFCPNARFLEQCRPERPRGKLPREKRKT